MEDAEAPEESKEQRLKREDQEWNAQRAKELKGMYMDDLKKLAASKGLSGGKKEDMVKLIIKVETKERAEKQAHEEKIRAVIQSKSDELKELELSVLKQRSNLKGRVSKAECVEHLLKAWQDDDGVDKALKEAALKERQEELLAKDSIFLVKLCDKNGIDPYVLEVK